MSNVAKHPWIVFGANPGGANKGIQVGWDKRYKAWTCSIYELKEPVEMGARFCKENVSHKITDIVFCKQESLKGFINSLMVLAALWEIQDEQELKESGTQAESQEADEGIAETV